MMNHIFMMIGMNIMGGHILHIIMTGHIGGIHIMEVVVVVLPEDILAIGDTDIMEDLADQVDPIIIMAAVEELVAVVEELVAVVEELVAVVEELVAVVEELVAAEVEVVAAEVEVVAVEVEVVEVAEDKNAYYIFT
jgi:hypothetical protein